MFYRADEPHGLPHNPFNGMVVPRPIGWISSLDAEGRANLAPYSFFNAVAYAPPQVMFSGSLKPGSDGFKDSIRNIQETGEFVHNVVTEELRDVMNLSSVAAPREVDEFEHVGLEKVPSTLVKAPRVARSPIHFECVLSQVVDLEAAGDGTHNRIVIGKVVGIHIDEAVLTDGLVDPSKLKPLSRLGYMDYGLLGEVFAMARPQWTG